MKIVMVEDDDALRRTLRRMLQQIAPEATVHEAATYAEGLALGLEGADLLFLDMRLEGEDEADAPCDSPPHPAAAPAEAPLGAPRAPRAKRSSVAGPGNGIDLLRELRARGCDAPAIMLSGYSDVRIVREALDAGAHDYIVKSDLDSATLNTLVRSATVRAGAINPGARAIVKRASGRMARRTTIYLDLSVAHALKGFCAKRNVDMSDVVNEALIMHLARVGV